MSATTRTATDEQKILEHIHEIFRAYLSKDREVIRRTHTDDWAGFQVQSETVSCSIHAAGTSFSLRRAKPLATAARLDRSVTATI